MSELQTGEAKYNSYHINSTMSEDAFVDPLGANGPLRDSFDNDSDEVEFEEEIDSSEPVAAQQIPPLKSADIDAVLAATRKEFAELKTANHRIEDDLDSETKDLFVVVDNPEKHATTMESYITFRVTTKTTRAEFDSPELQVRRRYNDFVWLRQRLADSQPTHIIPPLPEKHALRRLERFNPEFVKTRQGALQTFLQRVADHPVLSFNKHFQMFLEAKQWEFQAAKKEGSGFMSRMADSFHNMSASYMMKNRSAEFAHMNDYINTFSDKMGVMDRISQRIMKERYDYLTELNEYGPVFTLWSNSEDKLSQALGAVAKGVEKNFMALDKLMQTSEHSFSTPLKEYQLYAESVKGVLRRRDAAQMEYEMTQDELSKKKEERDQVMLAPQGYSIGSLLGRDPQEMRKQKEEKLQSDIQQLTKQVEVLNDKTVCANADLKADMDRWHKHKRRDFKKLLSDMADKQIQYYEDCIKSWEDIIPLISRTDVHFGDLGSSDSMSILKPDPDEQPLSSADSDHTLDKGSMTNRETSGLSNQDGCTPDDSDLPADAVCNDAPSKLPRDSLTNSLNNSLNDTLNETLNGDSDPSNPEPEALQNEINPAEILTEEI